MKQFTKLKQENILKYQFFLYSLDVPPFKRLNSIGFSAQFLGSLGWGRGEQRSPMGEDIV